jgi:predicted SprT family Zn-dependent metalloprotease
VISPSALDRERQDAFDAVGRTLGLGTWPEVPVRWNRRLRRAGRALIDTRGRRFEGAVIELSPAYFEVYPEDLAGILIHESVHVALAVKGRPCGHGPEFRAACEAAGGRLHSRWLPGRVYRYRCPVCSEELVRRRRAADCRWCAACAADAAKQGLDPYAPDRAMRLISTGWVGPDEAAARARPVCDREPGAAAGRASRRAGERLADLDR